MNNQTFLRPSTYLINANKQYPQAWKLIDEYIQEYSANWPEWCFLPLNANVFGVPPETFDNVPLFLSELQFLSSWRVAQGVYRFDPDVLEPLWNTTIEGDIPTDVLFSIPERCVYVETGQRDYADGLKMHGFFASLDFALGDPQDRSNYLAIFIDAESANGENTLEPYIFPLNIGGGVSPTIEELIAIYCDFQESPYFSADPFLEDPIVKNTVQEKLKYILPKIFSLLLYLCSENAEFRCPNGNTLPFKIPASTKTKKGPRYFPPNKPTVWDTAWRIGASIRSHRDKTTSSSNETGIGGVKRPHIRRAHWHSFWIGSRESERTIRIKWLPPIPVNVESPEDLIPVVRKVE